MININKTNFNNIFNEPPHYNFHDSRIHNINIDYKNDICRIELLEFGKQNATTLVLKNCVYHEIPKFKPWSKNNCDEISCIFGEYLNDFVDYIKEKRYFSFDKECFRLIENQKLDNHFLIIIEVFSGDYLKFIVTDLDIFDSSIEML